MGPAAHFLQLPPCTRCHCSTCDSRKAVYAAGMLVPSTQLIGLGHQKLMAILQHHFEAFASRFFFFLVLAMKQILLRFHWLATEETFYNVPVIIAGLAYSANVKMVADSFLSVNCISRGVGSVYHPDVSFGTGIASKSWKILRLFPPPPINCMFLT